MVDQFQNMNAKQISNESHKFIGWELADEGEDIPYEVALIGRREPTFGEIAHAKTLRDAAKQVISKD